MISIDWFKHFFIPVTFFLMIILTGYKGFIGKAFEKRIDPENLYRVEQSHAFDFLNQYDKWDEVDYDSTSGFSYQVQQRQT